MIREARDYLMALRDEVRKLKSAGVPVDTAVEQLDALMRPCIPTGSNQNGSASGSDISTTPASRGVRPTNLNRQGGNVPRFTRVAVLLVACVVASSVAAGAMGRTGGVPVPKGYVGVEASLPTTYPSPAKKGGSCTIGFQNPIAGNETLHTLQLAVVAQAKVYGCKVIALDDRTTPDKQVSNMQQLIAQKVNAIIFYPLIPRRRFRSSSRRRTRASRSSRSTEPLARGPRRRRTCRTSRHRSGRDATSRRICRSTLSPPPPRAPQVGLIGIGFPVPALKYLNQREAFWAKKAGLTVLGTQDNPSDDVTGGEKAANGLVQRYSDMNAVIGYNDPSASARRSPRAAPAGRSLSSA